MQPVELARGGEIGAERLLDDDAPPACGVAGVVRPAALSCSTTVP